MKFEVGIELNETWSLPQKVISAPPDLIGSAQSPIIPASLSKRQESSTNMETPLNAPLHLYLQTA